MDTANTLSISVRLQRVTTESAHVSVLITSDLIQSDADNPESGHIDTDKLIAAAIEQGKLAGTQWKSDGDCVITPHPLQTPPPNIG